MMWRPSTTLWLFLVTVTPILAAPTDTSTTPQIPGSASEESGTALAAAEGDASSDAPGLAAADVTAALDSPLLFLRSHGSEVQKLLASSPGDTLPPPLRERVKETINSAFDFHELSRLTLGSHWEERTPEERADFVDAYKGIVEEQNFDSFVEFYRDGKIEYQAEEVSGSRASVEAQIPVERELVGLTYRLHRIDDRWRIYDLVIDDVSTADGNRRRYSRYLSKHSYAELMDRLKSQLARLRQQD